MSTLVQPSTAGQWPGEVLAFAGQQHVEPYLGPLHEALGRVFPTARSVKVFVEADPEIRDDRHIVFEVRVPAADIADFVGAKKRWHRELFAICPAPLVCVFRMTLLQADA